MRKSLQVVDCFEPLYNGLTSPSLGALVYTMETSELLPNSQQHGSSQ